MQIQANSFIEATVEDHVWISYFMTVKMKRDIVLFIWNIWKRAVFHSTSQKLPQYKATKQNAYLHMLLSRISLLRTGDTKEAICLKYT